MQSNSVPTYVFPRHVTLTTKTPVTIKKIPLIQYQPKPINDVETLKLGSTRAKWMQLSYGGAIQFVTGALICIARNVTLAAYLETPALPQTTLAYHARVLTYANLINQFNPSAWSYKSFPQYYLLLCFIRITISFSALTAGAGVRDNPFVGKLFGRGINKSR